MNDVITTSRTTRRRGTTLVDLMMTIAVIGIVIVAIAPTLAPEDPVRLVAAGTLLVSDIEYAQSATLARPADPTIVKFDTKGAGYWLALASDPETPIARPGSDDEYRVTFGMGLAESLAGISADTSQILNQTITFDAFGRLPTLQNQSVTLFSDQGSIAIQITAATGSVHLSAEGPPPEPS